MTTTTETLVRSRMAGKIDDEEFELASSISIAVEHMITCGITGRVMDSRTAVAIQLWSDVSMEGAAVWTPNGEGSNMAWHTFQVVHESFLGAADIEKVKANMNANYGPEGEGWRFKSAKEIWDKVQS